jgi:hypothetical protein
MTKEKPPFVQYVFINPEEPVCKKKFTKFLLRISEETLDSIDKELLEREGMTKTGWILEAIKDKLRNKDE